MSKEITIEKALDIADWLIIYEEAIDMTNSPIPTREEQQNAFAGIIINHLEDKFYDDLGDKK